MSNQDGQEAADRYSQDRVIVNIKLDWPLISDRYSESGDEPGPSKWLLKNAAKYGFDGCCQEGKRKKRQATCQKAGISIYRKKKLQISRTQVWVWRIL